MQAVARHLKRWEEDSKDLDYHTGGKEEPSERCEEAEHAAFFFAFFVSKETAKLFKSRNIDLVMK